MQASVRSFVRREGRLTSAQKVALNRYANTFCYRLDGGELQFPHRGPCCLEIGAGDGTAVVALARANPHVNFIAAEVYRPGIGRILQQTASLGLQNLRLFTEDARTLIAALPNNVLEQVFIYFPDPWPKKRHHKRRLVQSAFLYRLAQVVARHGRLYIATDWAPYAEFIHTELYRSEAWQNLAGMNLDAPRPKHRAETKFEHRARQEGRTVYDFVCTPTGV